MVEEKLKSLLPSLQERKRYVKFRIISEEPVAYSNFEQAFWTTLLNFFGEVSVASSSIWIMKNLYDEKNQIGVIKCDNRSVEKVIACLGLISRVGDSRVIFKILNVSGTIKGLKLNK